MAGRIQSDYLYKSTGTIICRNTCGTYLEHGDVLKKPFMVPWVVWGRRRHPLGMPPFFNVGWELPNTLDKTRLVAMVKITHTIRTWGLQNKWHSQTGDERPQLEERTGTVSGGGCDPLYTWIVLDSTSRTLVRRLNWICTGIKNLSSNLSNSDD